MSCVTSLMRLRAQTPQVCCFASVACSLSCAVLATLLILALHAPRPARDGLFGDGLALSHHPEACDYAGMPLGIRTGRPSASSCGRWTAEWSSRSQVLKICPRRWPQNRIRGAGGYPSRARSVGASGRGIRQLRVGLPGVHLRDRLRGGRGLVQHERHKWLLSNNACCTMWS